MTLSSPIGDDNNRHVVSIYTPADQPDCTEDLISTVSVTEICLGDQLTLEAVSVSGALVTWDLGVQNGVPFVPVNARVVTYTAMSNDLNDCPCSVDITIHTLPIVFAGDDLLYPEQIYT